MLIQELIAKINEKYIDKDYQSAITKYLLKQNKQVFQNCNITNAQADTLVAAFNGDVKHDRLEIDGWIKTNFNESSQSIMADSAQPSLEELIKSGSSEWDRSYVTDADFRHIFTIDSVIESDGKAYCIGRPCPLMVSGININDQTGEILRDYISHFPDIFQAAVDKSAVLLIPLSVGSLHWVLGKIFIEQGVPQSAELYDSMSGDNSGYLLFKLLMCSLGINMASITYEFRGDQDDSFSNSRLELNPSLNDLGAFRCLDYVCREIAKISGQAEHPLVSLSGEALHQKVAEMIASKNNIELVPGSTALPLHDKDDVQLDLISDGSESNPENYDATSESTISDTDDISSGDIDVVDHPDAVTAIKNLRNVLLKTYPEKYANLGDSGLAISTIQSDDSGSCFEVSILSGSPSMSFPSNIQPMHSTPRKASVTKSAPLDFSDLHKSADPNDPTVAAENAFRLHYDDSSDEEDDGYDVASAGLQAQTVEALKKYRKSNKPPKVVGGQDDIDSVSFMLYAMGVMLLYSNKVKPYYQMLKEKQLMMRESDFLHFKKSVAKVFHDEYSQDFDISLYWVDFLSAFRDAAKRKAGTKKDILRQALAAVIKKNAPDTTKDMLDMVLDKLTPEISLPLWQPIGGVSISFDDTKQNVNLQVLATCRLQHRLARRIFKTKENDDSKTCKLIFNSGIYGTSCISEITVDPKKGTRTDLMKSLNYAYPSILNPKAANPKHAGKNTSIQKMLDVGFTPKSIVVSLKRVITGKKYLENNKTNRSYRDFLRKLYYLLMQTEVSRNPASILMTLMMINMIESYKKPFTLFFPRDAKQRELSSPNPEYRHPMMISKAPEYAGGLNRRFQVDGFRYQYDSKDCSSQDADKFSALQYALAVGWFKVKNNDALLKEADEAVVIAQLSDLAAQF